MNKTEAKQRLDAISEEVKELKRIINEPDEVTYRVGDWFVRNSEYYLLIQINDHEVCLVKVSVEAPLISCKGTVTRPQCPEVVGLFGNGLDHETFKERKIVLIYVICTLSCLSAELIEPLHGQLTI